MRALVSLSRALFIRMPAKTASMFGTAAKAIIKIWLLSIGSFNLALSPAHAERNGKHRVRDMEIAIR
jgi:hypothetical protein